MSDAIRLTPEEIQDYRELFKNYPEALDALDLIDESDGDLIESANMLAAEAGIEISSRAGEDVNILDKLAQKCRSVICDEDFMDDLMSGLLTAIGVNLRKKPEFSKKRKEGCRERKKLK